MRKRAFFYATVILFVASGLTACKKDVSTGDDGNNSNGGGTTTTTVDSFTTYTKDTTFANAVVIKYDSARATVTNPFASSGVSVTISGGDVVVTSTVTSTEINYVLSGKATNGSFKLYSDYKFTLVLNGVSLINDNGPAVNIQSSKKVTVNVLGGTANRLIDAATYATSTEDQKGAFFSEGQLNFGGTGTLSVTGNYKHGICSDGYIYIKESNITVTKTVSDAVHAKDYFKMESGTLNGTSSGDGIDCEEGYVAISGGNITVNSADDGITASYEGSSTTVTPYVAITGGIINVTTTGEKGAAIKSEGYTLINSSSAITVKVSGRGAKGIKTGRALTITNGNINITTSGAAYYDATDGDVAAPAGINCDGNFVFTAGSVTINSSGTAGKGLSVDSTVTVNGGTLAITTTGGKFTYSSTTSEAKAITADGAVVINNGTLNLSSADDGVKSDVSITFNGGTTNITRSTEGAEAPYVTVNNGVLNVVASDDGINTTFGTVSGGTESNDGSLLTITGGTLNLSSSGGDAMDSNGNIVMTGGTAVVQGPPSAPELAIDYNGTFNISGGLLIASGPNSGNMIQATGTTSSQYTVLIKVAGNIAAGTLVTIQNASGTNLVTYAPARTAYYLVYSSSALQSGATYKVLTGGTYSGGSSSNGYYTGGTFSGGTQKGTFTVSGKVTTVSL